MLTDMVEKQQNEKRQHVHHGKGVRFVRESLNISQIGLGKLIGETQQRISCWELKESLDESKLKRIADALKVPVEMIKNFSPEENAKNVINGNNQQNENNTFDNASIGQEIIGSQTNQYQVDTKIIELYESIIEEKNKLLTEKDLRIAELQRQLEDKK